MHDLLWVTPLCPVVGDLRKAVLRKCEMPAYGGIGSALGGPEAAGLPLSCVSG